MSKGTASMGKKNHHSHANCKRCGKTSFHKQKKRCSSCGYPDSKMRRYNWSTKAKRRNAKGTGRMRYEKNVQKYKIAGRNVERPTLQSRLQTIRQRRQRFLNRLRVRQQQQQGVAPQQRRNQNICTEFRQAMQGVGRTIKEKIENINPFAGDSYDC